MGPSESVSFQILPSSTGGTFSLQVSPENWLDNIKVETMYQKGAFNYQDYDYFVGSGTVSISYQGEDALSDIDLTMNISNDPKIWVYNYMEMYPSSSISVAITTDDLNAISPSELLTIKTYKGVHIDPPTLTRKHLAVFMPRGFNYSKETLVAVIIFKDGTDFTLYPIKTVEDDANESFLFDLSKEPSYVSQIRQIKVYPYNSHTISTVPPFIDGNIPPFADEE